MNGVLAEALQRAGVYVQAEERPIPRSETSAITPPNGNVRVFCDASCFGVFGRRSDPETVGAYAFYIPECGIKEGGIERGLTNTSLELLAAVNGVRAAAGVSSSRPINVYTDCTHTQFWFNEIRMRTRRKTHRSGWRGLDERTVEILELLQELMVRHNISAFLIKEDHTHHAVCHRLAKHTLRQALTPEQRRSIVSAGRVSEVLNQREKLLKKLAAMDEWLAENQEHMPIPIKK